MDRVLLEVDSGVALITVNDPDRRNAVTEEISAGLRLAVENAQNDPNVHAVVVTGAGKAFCAGADLSALGAAAEDGLRRAHHGAGLRCADRRAGGRVRSALPKARHSPRRRHDVDAAARRRTAGG